MTHMRAAPQCPGSISPFHFNTPKKQIKTKPNQGFISSMGSKERVDEAHKSEEKACQTWTLCLHAFSDLSHLSPAVFVYLLKECYSHGTRKATAKFRTLQQQVLQILHNCPESGPATFIVQTLYILPVLGPEYTEGFSHLVISSLRRWQTIGIVTRDSSEAKKLAAQLFLDVVTGYVIHEDRILIKLLEVFDVGLQDIEQALCKSDMKNASSDTAKAFLENYILRLIESQSYMTAVTLLEHFSIRQSEEAFLVKIIEYKQYKAAEKWAEFMGKQMLCVLVQKYIDMKKLKSAYEIIKKNNLKKEFLYVYHMCKESSLKKLAEKGCWEVAEKKTNNDRQLLQYLVYLAMEAGYFEKVDELCQRYSLEGFMKTIDPETMPSPIRYLHLSELVLEDIIWVDEVEGLHSATSHIEGCKIVGIDCEWKPNYEKGSQPNKVSIIQIASETKVYIIDLMKLFKDEPKALNSCLKRILHSPSILKLGYNLQCDLKQLAHSYGQLECFKHYEMLLDIQNVFKEPRGGLSGLAKKILGAGLNKTRRNSDWEQRPLSRNQLEYAALDAAVLVHIFQHVRSQSQPANVKEGQSKVEWKSYIISSTENSKKLKNTARSREEFQN